MTDVRATGALLEEVFPGSGIADAAYLEWLYERSPFGPVVEANFDDEQGRAGHYAVVPIDLARDGVARPAALSLNTAVHERARGGGMFVRLASETIRLARDRGIRAIVGVANANSTPGFVRRLGFELLSPLPATVILPTPGRRSEISSGAAEGDPFAPGGLAAGAAPLLASPARGEARVWTEATLRWRLARPGAAYGLHRREDLLAVTCADSRHGVRVAVILKVFAREPLGGRAARDLARAACLFHRAPLALHVGLNELARFPGLPLPQRFRESPLNLIYLDLEGSTASSPSEPAANVVRFEFLDFDAY
jgi:hypothetical protein